MFEGEFKESQQMTADLEEMEYVVSGDHYRQSTPKGERFLATCNTYWLDREYIISATYLRREHPVRQTLAAASVAGYLRSDDYKFNEETQTYPSFAADLLLEVGSALDRPKSKPAGTFEDPISGKILELERMIPGV
ncbi:hypothetical protein E8E15_001333 [Penicillium rubens]|nr:hypothetical protein E8E15_001333 [Penicillium rubens]